MTKPCVHQSDLKVHGENGALLDAVDASFVGNGDGSLLIGFLRGRPDRDATMLAFKGPMWAMGADGLAYSWPTQELRSLCECCAPAKLSDPRSPKTWL